MYLLGNFHPEQRKGCFVLFLQCWSVWTWKATCHLLIVPHRKHESQIKVQLPFYSHDVKSCPRFPPDFHWSGPTGRNKNFSSSIFFLTGCRPEKSKKEGRGLGSCFSISNLSYAFLPLNSPLFALWFDLLCCGVLWCGACCFSIIGSPRKNVIIFSGILDSSWRFGVVPIAISSERYCDLIYDAFVLSFF